jgi:hypothetical protein
LQQCCDILFQSMCLGKKGNICVYIYIYIASTWHYDPHHGTFFVKWKKEIKKKYDGEMIGDLSHLRYKTVSLGWI